jgi:hypothetical protein
MLTAMSYRTPSRMTCFFVRRSVSPVLTFALPVVRKHDDMTRNCVATVQVANDCKVCTKIRPIF